MAITFLSDLAIKVVADMPGYPPENVVQDKLRWAWEQLLEGSEVWREELDPIDSVTDQADYTLSPDEGVVIRVVEVKIDESVIDPAGYKMTDLSTLTFEEDFIPDQDITDGIVVNVSLAPDVDGITGPDWVLQRFHEGLVAGARYALYRMRGKPWSDIDPNRSAITENKDTFDLWRGKAVAARRQERTTRRIGLTA